MIFELYQDRKRKWHWCLRARNNKLVAFSADGYARRRGCMRVIAKLGSAFKYKVVGP